MALLYRMLLFHEGRQAVVGSKLIHQEAWLGRQLVQQLLSAVSLQMAADTPLCLSKVEGGAAGMHPGECPEREVREAHGRGPAAEQCVEQGLVLQS